MFVCILVHKVVVENTEKGNIPCSEQKVARKHFFFHTSLCRTLNAVASFRREHLDAHGIFRASLSENCLLL